MAGNAVKAMIGVVKDVAQKDHPGSIKVELFATGREENDCMWMPFLCHTDLNGFGFHSLPKAGDTVLVVGYGDTSDTYVAMANFWAIGQSPFQADAQNATYKVGYHSFDKKIKNELVFDKEKDVDLTKVKDVISEKEIVIDSTNPAKIANIFANTTLHYQWVIDETDPNNPTALISMRGGDSVIQMSNSGIDIYDKTEVNVFSEGNITLGAMGDVTVLSKGFNVQADDSFVVTSAGNIELTGKSQVVMNGKQILLNKQPDKPQPLQATTIKLPPPPELGLTKLRVNIQMPYVNTDGILPQNIDQDYVTFANYTDQSQNSKIEDDQESYLIPRDSSVNSPDINLQYNKDMSGGAGVAADNEQVQYINQFFNAWFDNFDISTEMEARQDNNNNTVYDVRLTVSLKLTFPKVDFLVPKLVIDEKDDDDENNWTNYASTVNGEKTFFVQHCLKDAPKMLFDVPSKHYIVKIPLKFPNVFVSITDANDNNKERFSGEFTWGNLTSAYCREYGYYDGWSYIK